MTATAIKAIETRYAGHRFRSRLEARWAVFFDALGVEWLYEPQGYDINGAWYLPDFWLPREHCWVEVKGRFGDPSEWLRLIAAVRDGLPAEPDGLPMSDLRVVWSPSLLLLGKIPSVGIAGIAKHTELRLQVDGRRQVHVVHGHRAFRRHYLMPFGYPIPIDRVGYADAFLDEYEELQLYWDSDVAAAFTKARSARFEHGECG
jgi:hypothetical protein